MTTIDVARVQAVAIGASAGGVDALAVLLPALPPRLRAPVFVVLHLPPDRPSVLADLMQRYTSAEVREAEDKDAVVDGRVYFAPPDYHLLIDDGQTLALSADEPLNYSRPSIDALFESAADAYGDGLLAIVLTGASRDGADGLRAVRAAGGMTLVQDPRDARVPLMTEEAIRSGAVDLVLPLHHIAGILQALPHD